MYKDEYSHLRKTKLKIKEDKIKLANKFAKEYPIVHEVVETLRSNGNMELYLNTIMTISIKDKYFGNDEKSQQQFASKLIPYIKFINNTVTKIRDNLSGSGNYEENNVASMMAIVARFNIPSKDKNPYIIYNQSGDWPGCRMVITYDDNEKRYKAHEYNYMNGHGKTQQEYNNTHTENTIYDENDIYDKIKDSTIKQIRFTMGIDDGIGLY